MREEVIVDGIYQHCSGEGYNYRVLSIKQTNATGIERVKTVRVKI